MPKHKWKKGQSGNPKGRPPVLSREFQSEIDSNRRAVKALILQYLNMSEAQIYERQSAQNLPIFEKMLAQCIDRITSDGDVLRMRALLEIVLGKIPEDKEPLELSEDEKALIATYRKKLEEKQLEDNSDPS